MTLKSLKKNKKIKPKTLKYKKSLKKNKKIKPKTLKYKKSLRGGALWSCARCTFNNPEMNSSCGTCFNPKSKSSGGKKKTKKKRTILESEPPYVFTIENGVILIARNSKPVPLDRTFNISLPGNKLNLGLFQIKDNSCWLDSGLFALFITRNKTIFNALFKNPLLPLLRRGRNEVEMICSALEIEGDEQGNRLRQITARGAIRDEMALLHRHIFSQRERRIILKEGLRKLLGSLGLSNLDWGGIQQANSEEFIGKLLDLFPVKEEEKINVIIRKGYALKKEDLLLSHRELIENQSNLYEQCKILISKSVERYKIKTGFKYVHNDMTENKLGILMIIPRDIIKYSTDNFVTPRKPYLSDLLFGKQILPAANGDIVEHRDENFEGGIKCEFKFNSYEKIVKCPGGILLVHLYRIPETMPGNMLTTPIIPDFTIYPEGTEESGLYLTAAIVKTGSARGGHYTCFFREGDDFFLFDDCSPTIEYIGKYHKLLRKNIGTNNVETNGVFFIYKAPSNSDEERLIKQNYSVFSNPPSDSGGGSAKPTGSRTTTPSTLRSGSAKPTGSRTTTPSTLRSGSAKPTGSRTTTPSTLRSGSAKHTGSRTTTPSTLRSGSAKPTGSRTTTPSTLRSSSVKPSQKLTLLDMAKEINIPNYEKNNNETLRSRIKKRVTLLELAKEINIPNYDKMNNEILRSRIDKRLTLLEKTKGLENQEAMTNKKLMEYVKEAKKYNLLN